MPSHWSGSPNVKGSITNMGGGRAPAPRTLQNSSGTGKSGTNSVKAQDSGKQGYPGLGKPASNALKK